MKEYIVSIIGWEQNGKPIEDPPGYSYEYYWASPTWVYAKNEHEALSFFMQHYSGADQYGIAPMWEVVATTAD